MKYITLDNLEWKDWFRTGRKYAFVRFGDFRVRVVEQKEVGQYHISTDAKNFGSVTKEHANELLEMMQDEQLRRNENIHKR